MPRNPEVLAIFEKADDGIQGVFGYYAFAAAMFNTSYDRYIIEKLPEFTPMTVEWIRIYDKQDLITAMREVFPYYHARTCLIAVVSLFENAVSRFWDCLNEAGYPQNGKKRDGYKDRLRDWVFVRVKSSTYGSKEMINRIPQNLRDIDHARRLRNCFLHFNGLLNKRYEDDAIEIDNKFELIPDYREWKDDPSQEKPVILSIQDFMRCYIAHLEILHQLHDVIQREDFGETGPGYNYEKEGKIILWRRILIGV